MVSTRRKIVSEQDRFGGYSRQPSAMVSIDDANDETQDFESSPTLIQESAGSRIGTSEKAAENEQKSFAYARRTPMVNNRQQDIVEYSRVAYPSAREFSETLATPKKQFISRRREREDLMPSIKTRAYNKDDTYAQAATKRKTGVHLKSKTKALLAIYMVVVVILAALVIATGIAVSNINSEVSNLEVELAVKNQQIVLQNGQIDKITDKNYIAGIAMGKDMEKIDSVVSVKKLPIVNSIKYESRSNWFDQFCDWLSNIIGG